MKKFVFNLGLIILATFAILPHVKAADSEMAIKIHKNDLSGEIWADENQQIKLNIQENGANLGIGQSINGINDITKYSPNAGALRKTDTIDCVFNWNYGEEEIKKVYSLDRYEQAPAGEFYLPPTRITQKKLIFIQDTIPHCGGDDSDFQDFYEWLSAMPDNPFTDYSETLTLDAESGKTYKVNINNDANGQIYLAQGNSLTGYTCTDTLCEDQIQAGNGVNKIDLVIMRNDEEEIAPTSSSDLIVGDNAEYSQLITMIGKFTIRSGALLDWSLAINETGLRNTKIEQIFNKFLNIANGLFIISLLAIAFLWNFSALLPKSTLKKMLAYFAIAMILVNFTLPLTRLVVDGANLVQDSLLIKSTAEDKERISSKDILVINNENEEDFIGLRESSYLKQAYPQNLGAEVDKDNLSQKNELYVDQNAEYTYFNAILIFLGALAEFIIALILVFRYTILWFLLILSPFLCILFIFSNLRPIFNYWVFLFTRWILIGPILAMSLFIVINIWMHTGVPLESAYSGPSDLLFPSTTNLNISAVGVNSGSLETPREVMKYITALIMLYLTILLPFWLTRRISVAVNNSKDNGGLLSNIFNKQKSAQQEIIQEKTKSEEKESSKISSFRERLFTSTNNSLEKQKERLDKEEKEQETKSSVNSMQNLVKGNSSEELAQKMREIEINEINPQGNSDKYNITNQEYRDINQQESNVNNTVNQNIFNAQSPSEEEKIKNPEEIENDLNINDFSDREKGVKMQENEDDQ